MEQHFEADNFIFPGSQDRSFSDLPLIAPNEIDGYFAEVENQPPITPFSEVKNNIILS